MKSLLRFALWLLRMSLVINSVWLVCAGECETRERRSRCGATAWPVRERLKAMRYYPPLVSAGALALPARPGAKPAPIPSSAHGRERRKNEDLVPWTLRKTAATVTERTRPPRARTPERAGRHTTRRGAPKTNQGAPDLNLVRADNPSACF